MKVEDYFLNIAKKENKPSVLLCDRGVMDSKAYVDNETWQMVLDETGWSEVMLRERRYDGVLHMVTAAEGAEAFYTTANNEARSEDKEIALWIDHNLRRAWNGHPCLRIIGNDEFGFDAKIKNAWSHVSTMIGLAAESGYYRKFLIEPDFKFPEDINVIFFEVEDTFLRSLDLKKEIKVTKSVMPPIKRLS